MKKKINSKRYYLGNTYHNKYFTAQEARYMFYTLKGLNNEKIAHAMSCSPGTLASYCANIRLKIPSKNKKELAKKIEQTDFMKFLKFFEITEEHNITKITD